MTTTFGAGVVAAMEKLAKIKPGLFTTDMTQNMTPEERKLVKKKFRWYQHQHLGILPSAAVGAAGANAASQLARLGPRGRAIATVAGAVAHPTILSALALGGKYDKSSRRLLEKAREK